MFVKLLKKMFVTNKIATQTRRPKASFIPGMEALEARWVPASLGVKLAVLDFTGGTLTAAEMAASPVNNGVATVSGFSSLFTTAQDANSDGVINVTDANIVRSRLDMNADGLVNNTDFTLARDRILAKVRQDYAPYAIQIVAAEKEAHSGRFNDFFTQGDAFMMVTGGGNTINTNFSAAGIFGIGPMDLEAVIDLSPADMASWSHEHDTEVVSERRFGCGMGVFGALFDLDARGCAAAGIPDARSLQCHPLCGQDGMPMAFFAA